MAFEHLAASTDPGIRPNTSGLPGLDTFRTMIGAMVPFALGACVLAILLGALVWAVASNSANPHYASRGKTTVIAAAVAAVLIGGANTLIGFFARAGQGI